MFINRKLYSHHDIHSDIANRRISSYHAGLVSTTNFQQQARYVCPFLLVSEKVVYQKLKQNHSAVSTNHNIQLEAFSGIIALIWENDEV